MLPQKNIEYIKKMAEKYEDYMQKLKSNKYRNIKNSDSEKLCKNILVMYNDSVTTSQNIYMLFVHFKKNPVKSDINVIKELCTRIKETQCAFITLVVESILKLLNIPVNVSKTATKNKYEQLTQALANKLQTEKNAQPQQNNASLYIRNIYTFASAISSVKPDKLSDYLNSNPSKFLDHILAFCLTYTSYIDTLLSSIDLALTTDLNMNEIIEYFNEQTEFLDNVTKNKKVISLSLCDDPEKIKDFLSNMKDM